MSLLEKQLEFYGLAMNWEFMGTERFEGVSWYNAFPSTCLCASELVAGP